MKACDKSPNKIKIFFNQIRKDYDRENVKKLLTSHKKHKRIKVAEEQVTQPKKKKPNITIDPEYSNPIIVSESSHKTPERLAEKVHKLKVISKVDKGSMKKNLEEQKIFEDFSFKGKNKDELQNEDIISLKCNKESSENQFKKQAREDCFTEGKKVSKRLNYGNSHSKIAENKSHEPKNITHKRCKSEINPERHEKPIQPQIADNNKIQDEKYHQYLRDVEFIKIAKSLKKGAENMEESRVAIINNTNSHLDNSNSSTMELERMMIKLNKERYQLEKSIKLLDLKSKRLRENSPNVSSLKQQSEIVQEDFLDRWRLLESEDINLKTQSNFERSSSRRLKSEDGREILNNSRVHDFQTIFKEPLGQLELKPANRRTNSFLGKENNGFLDFSSRLKTREEMMDHSSINKQKIDFLSQELSNMMTNLFKNKNECVVKKRFF